MKPTCLIWWNKNYCIFRRVKNLAQDFDASSAPRVSYGGQMNRETHIDGKNMGLGDEQLKLLKAFDSKSLTDQVSVWSMW